MVPRPAPEPSPGNLLEMQIVSSHVRLPETETLGLELHNSSFDESSKWVWWMFKCENHGSWWWGAMNMFEWGSGWISSRLSERFPWLWCRGHFRVVSGDSDQWGSYWELSGSFDMELGIQREALAFALIKMQRPERHTGYWEASHLINEISSEGALQPLRNYYQGLTNPGTHLD